MLILLLLSCFTAALSEGPSVIVIGAGASGVAATTKLLENDIDNIVVLEAENRVGGRIRSVFFGDAFVDLGAEWCMGEKDNIVYNLVKDYDILKHTEIPVRMYQTLKPHLQNERQFSNELFQIMMETYESSENSDVAESESIGDYCITKYNKTIYERFKGNPDKIEVGLAAVDYFEHWVNSNEGSTSWYAPSAKSDFWISEGDQDLNWNGLGYKTILDVLMKKYPKTSQQLPFDRTVQLNKEVVQITWNNNTENNRITIKCADNTVYIADHVIFTPSLGVLKKNHKTLFFPELPETKQKAIDKIGFGLVMKVVMFFKNKWWGEVFEGAGIIWSPKDKAMALKKLSEDPMKEGRVWVTELFSIVPAENNTNVIIAWFAGDMIHEIETISNETMINGLVFVLKKFLGHRYNVTAPDAIIRSSWGNNPHFRGTYSYQTVEGRKWEISPEIELSKPLLDHEGRLKVQFAGEATHPHRFGSVHGAIETGHREANRIIQLYKKPRLHKVLMLPTNFD